jgi:hypothetical protein
MPDLLAKQPKECLPQGREGFDIHQTCRQDDHQPSDPTTTNIGMSNQRRGHTPDPDERRYRSDLTTATKQHQPDQHRPISTPMPLDLDIASPNSRLSELHAPTRATPSLPPRDEASTEHEPAWNSPCMRLPPGRGLHRARRGARHARGLRTGVVSPQSPLHLRSSLN